MGACEKMNGNKVKVSVVIPVRNSSMTLPECIRSVLSQDFEGYEVLVVDNDSTDDTKDVILGFSSKDKRVRYVFEGFVSRGAARNRGVTESRGDIVVMTDSDCTVPKDWIRRIIKPIEEGEDVVQGGEDMAETGFWSCMQQRANERFSSLHSDGGYISHVDTKNVAIRRSALKKVGMFDWNISTFEDYEFKVRLLRRGYKIVHKPGIKVVHRHRSSASELFRRRFEMGKWIAYIQRMHSRDGNSITDEMTKSLSPVNLVAFIPWTASILLRGRISDFVFEAFTGTAWRLGILSSMLSKNELDNPASQARD
jgi:glycosyltransferase involved in cell wall biosynthesis